MRYRLTRKTLKSLISEKTVGFTEKPFDVLINIVTEPMCMKKKLSYFFAEIMKMKRHPVKIHTFMRFLKENFVLISNFEEKFYGYENSENFYPEKRTFEAEISRNKVFLHHFGNTSN